MASASILGMNYSTGLDELNSSLANNQPTERTHYWKIERKAMRGKGWTTVKGLDLYMTKSEAAEFWCKHYRGKAEFRLRHLLAY